MMSSSISCTSRSPSNSREIMTPVQRPQFRVLRGPEMPAWGKQKSSPEGAASTTDSQSVPLSVGFLRGQSPGSNFGQVSPRSSTASFTGGEDTNSESASTKSCYSNIKDSLSNSAKQGNSSNGMQLAGVLLARAKALHKEATVPEDASVPNGNGKPNNVDSTGGVISTLAALQDNISQQQTQLRDLVNGLAKQWEQRFASVEEAVNNGLRVATATATATNERSARFLKLGEVLDGAVKRVTTESGNIAALKQQVDNMESYMEEMARKLNEEKAARSQAIENLVFQMEGKVAVLHEHVEVEWGRGAASGARSRDSSEAPSRFSTAGPVSGQLSLQENLSQEVEAVASETASLRERLDSSNEHVLRLSRDLHATRDEVRQLAGELTRVWSSEIAGGTAIRTELRSEIAWQIQQLGHELRVETSRH